MQIFAQFAVHKALRERGRVKPPGRRCRAQSRCSRKTPSTTAEKTDPGRGNNKRKVARSGAATAPPPPRASPRGLPATATRAPRPPPPPALQLHRPRSRGRPGRCSCGGPDPSPARPPHREAPPQLHRVRPAPQLHRPGSAARRGEASPHRTARPPSAALTNSARREPTAGSGAGRARGLTRSGPSRRVPAASSSSSSAAAAGLVGVLRRPPPARRPRPGPRAPPPPPARAGSLRRAAEPQGPTLSTAPHGSSPAAAAACQTHGRERAGGRARRRAGGRGGRGAGGGRTTHTHARGGAAQMWPRPAGPPRAGRSAIERKRRAPAPGPPPVSASPNRRAAFWGGRRSGGTDGAARRMIVAGRSCRLRAPIAGGDC